MSVQENKRRYEQAVRDVKEHCMCAKFEEAGGYFRVIYPDGYFPQGVQCRTNVGKIEALGRVLRTMEKHWKESFV